jgi:hypothetical protein
MRVRVLPLIVGLLSVAAGASPRTQTPAQTQPAQATATDVYHVHFAKAAPGQADALGKALQQPDPTSPMPDHFILLRHQEGDDWDYAVIQHLGQKPTVTATAPPSPARDLRSWHDDTFASGPSWADFTREMGIGGSGKPGAVYTLGVHRALPGHRDQLLEALSGPAPGQPKVQSGTVLLQHLEGGDWTFLTITRNDSWQDFATERAAATSAPDAARGWAEIRQHSAFHRDTIADRIYPVK